MSALGTIYRQRGKDQEPVEGLSPGDIGVVAKLSDTGTGDTLRDQGQAYSAPDHDLPRARLTAWPCVPAPMLPSTSSAPASSASSRKTRVFASAAT